MIRTIILPNVPEAVLRGLRQRARRNDRSIQKEILSILKSATVDRASLAAQLTALRTRLGANMTLNEINKAIAEGRP
jgi:plasmid stability protein